MQAYGLDLARHPLHWWQFRALFRSLPEETQLVKIIGYRTMKIPAKASKEQRQHYEHLKQNMTVHRWFANKACPGDYLYQRHGAIAEAVNAKLGTGTEQTVSSFPAVPFTVRVIINDLNYREGPGMSYAVKGQTGKGVFTITEVQDGWGKLKSGAGWIYLENPAYCTILDDGQTEAQKAVERLAQDIAAQLKSSGCDAAAVLKRVSEILA